MAFFLLFITSGSLVVPGVFYFFLRLSILRACVLQVDARPYSDCAVVRRWADKEGSGWKVGV